MARQIDWNDIPDRASLGAGYYRMKIRSITELPIDERSPYLTFLAAFEVEEPKDSEGENHFERFKIGDEEDPQANQKATWRKSLGAKNLKKLLKSANAPFLDTDEATYEAARGNSFIGKITKVAGRAGTQNEGQEFSNMRGYFSITSPEALQVGKDGMALSTYGNGAAMPVGGQEMTCPICTAKVPRSDYGRHLGAHKAEPARIEN